MEHRRDPALCRVQSAEGTEQQGARAVTATARPCALAALHYTDTLTQSFFFLLHAGTGAARSLRVFALQNVPERIRAEGKARAQLCARGQRALLEAHELSRAQTRLPRRLVSAARGVAHRVPRLARALGRVVLKPRALSALVARAHQGARGVRHAPRLPRGDHLQPEPAPASAHEQTGYLQRGTLARATREKPASLRGRGGGSGRAGGFTHAVPRAGFQSVFASAARSATVHETAAGPARASAGGDAAVLPLPRRALRPAQLQHRKCARACVRIHRSYLVCFYAHNSQCVVWFMFVAR